MKNTFFIVFILAILASTNVSSIAAPDSTAGSFLDMSNQQNLAAIIRIGLYDPKGDHLKGGDGIEATLRYKPLFFLATELGIGYYNHVSENQFKITVPDPSGTPATIYNGDNKMQMIPVTASVKLMLPVELGNVYAGGGVGYYFKKISGFRDETDNSGGFQFGGGFEINLTKSEMFLFDYKRMIIKKGFSSISDIDFSGDVYSAGFGWRF